MCDIQLVRVESFAARCEQPGDSQALSYLNNQKDCEDNPDETNQDNVTLIQPLTPEFLI